MIFKRVGDSRPYPGHGYTQKQWSQLAPVQVRLDQLVTTKSNLDLANLLEDDSTFYGDLFAHVVATSTLRTACTARFVLPFSSVRPSMPVSSNWTDAPS